MIDSLIILCSLLGIAGAVLNCVGRLKYSYILWVFGNAGWIAITLLTNGSVFVLSMWGVYASTSVIGLYNYRWVKE